MRILLIEDEPAVARMIDRGLTAHGYQMMTAETGEDGLLFVMTEAIDLVLLDILLPGRDGHQILADIRRQHRDLPVIMLTARDTTLDKVHSLDYGADDYVTKPFEMEELLARIRALIRRSEGEEILRVSDLEVNTTTREVRRGEREIDVTAREYDLLEFMVRNPRRVLSREFLLSRVWDQEFGLTTNVVDVYVAYLRKKVDAPGEEKLIRTVRGTGYALRGA